MKEIIRSYDLYSTADISEALKFWGQEPVEDLNEMAVYLKDFKKRVDGLRFRLVENWCLCMYCSLYDKKNNNFNHWKEELAACIINIKRVGIKNRIDKRETLVRMLTKDYEYKDSNKIFNIARDKFVIEKIPLSKLESPSKEFSHRMSSLVDVLTYEDRYPILDYINKTFK